MPKSKRAKIVHLSKVEKRGKERTLKLFSNVREGIDTYQYCWVYSVEAMRNTYLKDVRSDLSDSRIFFGKTKVMAKAFGLTAEEAHAENTHRLARYLNGNVGLLFTNRIPADIRAYFHDYCKTDYARAGTVATRNFIVPPGVVMSTGGEIPTEEDVVLPHNIEPELRKLGMPTTLLKGKIMLQNEYMVCKEGQALDSRQTRLLKLFGIATADFKVTLKACWSSATGEVTVEKSIE